MAQVTVYLREKDVENLKKLVAEFDKKNLLPKNNRSTVTEKVLKDYIEMMSEMRIEKGEKVFDRNLIFEYAKQVSETKTKDDELEKEKVALLNSFMERFLARKKRMERLESELQELREFAASVKFESGSSVLDLYKKRMVKGGIGDASC
ncbi:hypothetical protein FC48_GL001852 [Ligilactobacillus murinus DSM 20452 = NBRC 14221]|uniref:Uncharacterized protein n=1 Tax=Ligilactobacillus murinus DSM 20452 = NBRC 14221 TaxID=1423772 RepID=A0A0R2BAD8_9LACO|nr:hypothetical protein [Ligilactobacillus murinus]KRM76463.1 hypothetical protein FC48_GL001852 [Ligilactobacillus murinus DSM 20452 = NBRC 14221]MBC9710046.1 hypothetical protein [Enterococcus sp.]